MTPTFLYWPTGGTSWSPSDLGSLAAWYKADELAQSDDTEVTTWANAEGTSGRDLSGVGTTKPKFRTSIQNGLGVVRFNGSNNFEVTSASSWLPSTDDAWTAAVVGKVVSTANHVFLGLSDITDQNGYPRIDLVRKSDTANQPWVTLSYNSGTLRYATGPNQASATGYELAVSILNASLQPTHRINGEAASLTFNGAWSDYSAVPAGTPPELYVGCSGGSNTYSARLPNTAEIAEIILCTSAVAATDAEKIEGYLAHKWGLTANLPSTHPYKSTAP